MLKDAGVSLHMGYSRKAGIDVPDAFEVCEETVILTHEEHKPIELPPGKYSSGFFPKSCEIPGINFLA